MNDRALARELDLEVTQVRFYEIHPHLMDRATLERVDSLLDKHASSRPNRVQRVSAP